MKRISTVLLLALGTSAIAWNVPTYAAQSIYSVNSQTKGNQPVTASKTPMTAQEIQTATADIKKRGIDALKDLSVSDLSDIMKNPTARKAFMKLRVSMTKQSKTRGIKSVDKMFRQPQNSILMNYDDAILFLKLQYLMASTNLYGANRSDEMYVFQTECALASIQEAIDGRLEMRLRTSKTYGDPIVKLSFFRTLKTLGPYMFV